MEVRLQSVWLTAGPSDRILILDIICSLIWHSKWLVKGNEHSTGTQVQDQADVEMIYM